MLVVTMEDPLELIQNRGTVDILVTLFGEGKLNVSQLSKEADVCSGTIQRRLRELKENELIIEKIGESENNRLQKAYKLTDTGENICEALLNVKEACEVGLDGKK